MPMASRCAQRLPAIITRSSANLNATSAEIECVAYAERTAAIRPEAEPFVNLAPTAHVFYWNDEGRLMDHAERKKQSKTLPPDLVQELWTEIKGMRDHAAYLARLEADRETRLDSLLRKMGDAGMSDHLPTLEDVRAVWRGDN